MSAYLSPAGNEQQSDANGAPVSGALINTYAAGTTTPITTYTDAAGLVPQQNPIVCNAAGYPSSPIYLPSGQAVKMVFTTSVASGSVAYRPAVDNIQGVNDPSYTTTQTEWTPYSATASFISATSFSVAGDQRGTFQVGRRVKTTNTGGTVYGTISASSFGSSITTVTVVNDSGVIDSGLSAVAYGLLAATSPSVPSLFLGRDLLTSVAGTNTITGSVAGLTAYAAGARLKFVAAGKNTAAVTLNVNGLGAKAITKFGTAALVDGDIQSGSVVSVSYDGTQFQLEGVATQGSLAGGWQKLPNGFIEQWTNNVTTSATNDVGWTFPIAFPTACQGVWPTYTNGSGSASVVCSVGATSVTGTNIGAYVTNTGARTSASIFVRAIGY